MIFYIFKNIITYLKKTLTIKSKIIKENINNNNNKSLIHKILIYYLKHIYNILYYVCPIILNVIYQIITSIFNIIKIIINFIKNILIFIFWKYIRRSYIYIWILRLNSAVYFTIINKIELSMNYYYKIKKTNIYVSIKSIIIIVVKYLWWILNTILHQIILIILMLIYELSKLISRVNRQHILLFLIFNLFILNSSHYYLNKYKYIYYMEMIITYVLILFYKNYNIILYIKLLFNKFYVSILKSYLKFLYKNKYIILHKTTINYFFYILLDEYLIKSLAPDKSEISYYTKKSIKLLSKTKINILILILKKSYMYSQLVIYQLFNFYKSNIINNIILLCYSTTIISSWRPIYKINSIIGYYFNSRQKFKNYKNENYKNLKY